MSVLYAKYYSCDQFKGNEMGGACSPYGEKEYAGFCGEI